MTRRSLWYDVPETPVAVDLTDYDQPARYFNGSNQAIYWNGWPVGALGFSMAAWVYPLSVAEGVVMGFTSNVAGSGYAILRTLTGSVYAQTDDTANGAHYAISTAPVVVGKWQHIAAVFNSTTLRTAYVNGSGNGTNTDTEAFPALGGGTPYVAVGAMPPFWSNASWSLGFNGIVAWPVMWDIALSNADVTLLATGINPRSLYPRNIRFCPDLWTLDYWGGAASGSPIRGKGGARMSENAGPSALRTFPITPAFRKVP